MEEGDASHHLSLYRTPPALSYSVSHCRFVSPIILTLPLLGISYSLYKHNKYKPRHWSSRCADCPMCVDPDGVPQTTDLLIPFHTSPGLKTLTGYGSIYQNAALRTFGGAFQVTFDTLIHTTHPSDARWVGVCIGYLQSRKKSPNVTAVAWK